MVLRRQVTLLAIGGLVLGAGALVAQPQANEQGIEFFEKRVRPLLVDNCVPCHGEKVQQGKLRLDSRTFLMKGGERGVVVAANVPEKSLLIQAVQYHDPNLQMPPKGKLSEEQIAALTEWVKMGTPWTAEKNPVKVSSANTGIDIKARAQHWTFRPLQHPSLPKVKTPQWVKTPIDNFILAKLEEKALTPSAPTDKYTLLRRATYDLTGLPPTPKEIQAFLADKAPNAYEKVVERLLASPHYGEKWGRHWLDLMRYAETDGHEFDFEKPGAYQYRDYVIRAFNADVPYNQFVMEHLAGDLLPSPRRNEENGWNESIFGTTWWWLGEGKHSPVDLRVDQAERTDNQLDVMGKTFLGLSLGCVRCHDHKFDPLTQKDYYALAGIANSTRQHLMPIVPPNQKETARELTELRKAALPTVFSKERSELMEQLWDFKTFLLEMGKGTKLISQGQPTRSERWQQYMNEVASRDQTNLFYPWAVLSRTDPKDYDKVRTQIVQQLRDATSQAERLKSQQVVFEDFGKQGYEGWDTTGAAFGEEPRRLSVVVSDKEPQIVRVWGSGIADSGAVSQRLAGTLRSKTFAISKKYIQLRLAGNDCLARIVIDGFQRITYPIYGGLNVKPNSLDMTWYNVDVTKWVGHNAYIEFVDNGEGRIAVDEIAFADTPEVPRPPDVTWIWRLAGADGRNLESLADMYQTLLRSAVQYLWLDQGNSLSTERYMPIINWMLKNLSTLNGTVKKVSNEVAAAPEWEKFRKREQEIPIGELVQVAHDGTGVDEQIQVRGNPKTLGAVAPRRFPEVFFGTQPLQNHEGSGRLELAQKLTSAQNPLLPRVIVNRIWHYHFGRGIVKTVDDFGLRSDTPSHPQLLEWLATDFIKSGWSIKHLHRLIMLSSTYRMTSTLDPTKEAKDPTNQYLHRMPVKRLEAEEIRDGILAVSGRLDPTLFGKSVLPFLTPYMDGRGKPTSSGPLDGNGRRSIYISVRRNFLTPMFLAFDYPVPFNTMGRRSVSNVPAQALVLMNNPLVLEQAKRWAESVVNTSNQSVEQKIQGLYLTALGRPAKPEELRTALDFLKIQEGNYGKPNDVRAWQDLCHVLFNVKEFVFIP